MAPRINIPPLTRFLLVGLLVLSFLTGAIRYTRWARTLAGGDKHRDEPASTILIPYLTIVPQLSVFYPWVFLTATLVEQNIFGLIVTLATVFYGGRYLERAWSSADLAKFMLVISLLPNLVAFAIYVGRYAVTGNMMRTLTTISGGTAIQGGFLVAFKQLVPEHTVTIARGVIKLRVKHFPAIFLLGNTVAGIVLGLDTALILAWMGFLSAWIYLRFYKFSPDLSSSSTGASSGIRGDASETFAFAAFFPDPLSTPIAAASDKIYDALVAMRICTPFSAEDVEAGNEQAMAREEGGLPSLLNGGGTRAGVRGGGKREEAERRRALALKALDQRLHAASNRAQSAPVHVTASGTPEANGPSEPHNAGSEPADGRS